MRTKDKTLIEALNAVVLRELPKQYKEGAGFWIEAILLVRKRNLQECYVLASRDCHGATSITCDFDGTSSVMSIIGCYPYTYLDYMGYDVAMPIKEKKSFIRGMFAVATPTIIVDRMKDATSEELDIIAREVLINRQLENRQEDVDRNAAEERKSSVISLNGVEEMQDVGVIQKKTYANKKKVDRSFLDGMYNRDFLFKE